MSYLIDASSLINFKHYYEEIFSSLWQSLEELVNNNELFSVREVFNEVSRQDDKVVEWCKKHKQIFLIPDEVELKLVSDILSKHKELIKKKNILSGSPDADPFLIAVARNRNYKLITEEKLTPNAHKIPNICMEMGVEFLSLKDFMIELGWKF